MATSNPVGRYLGSTKNLTGAVAGLLGVLLWAVGAVGSAWPLVVAGLYLAGALAAPAEKVHLVTDDTASLRTALARLRGSAGRLPAPSAGRLTHIADVLGSVLVRAGLAADPESAHGVARLIRTDVPTAVETYLNLPWWLTTGRKAPGEELSTQLELLSADAEAVAGAFFARDLNRQSDHTRYLRDRTENPEN